MRVVIKKTNLLALIIFSFVGIAGAEITSEEVENNKPIIIEKKTFKSYRVGAERVTSALIGLAAVVEAIGIVVHNVSAREYGYVGVVIAAVFNSLVNSSAVVSTKKKKRMKSLLKALNASALVSLYPLKTPDKDQWKDGPFIANTLLTLQLGIKGLCDLRDLIEHGCSELE